MPDPVTIVGDNPNDAALRFVRTVQDPEVPFHLVNSSTAAQVLTAETPNYLRGSRLQIPRSRALAPGTMFRWRMSITKTAAGTALSLFQVRVGAAGNETDTLRIGFTKPAGTAAVDEARVDIRLLVRSVGATGTWAGQFHLAHNLSATGHATVPNVVLTGTPAAWDMTPRNLFVGVSVSPGASEVYTVEMVEAEVLNLGVATS